MPSVPFAVASGGLPNAVPSGGHVIVNAQPVQNWTPGVVGGLAVPSVTAQPRAAAAAPTASYPEERKAAETNLRVSEQFASDQWQGAGHIAHLRAQVAATQDPNLRAFFEGLLDELVTIQAGVRHASRSAGGASKQIFKTTDRLANELINGADIATNGLALALHLASYNLRIPAPSGERMREMISQGAYAQALSLYTTSQGDWMGRLKDGLMSPIGGGLIAQYFAVRPESYTDVNMVVQAGFSGLAAAFFGKHVEAQIIGYMPAVFSFFAKTLGVRPNLRKVSAKLTITRGAGMTADIYELSFSGDRGLFATTENLPKVRVTGLDGMSTTHTVGEAAPKFTASAENFTFQASGTIKSLKIIQAMFILPSGEATLLPIEIRDIPVPA